jgi:hypothetical protein
MSNTLTLIPTKFQDIRSGDVTYGYRIFDSYDDSYSNTWESIPDDDMEFLKMVLDETVENYSQVVLEMFNFLQENEKGLDIDGTFYDFEDIKEILVEHLG